MISSQARPRHNSDLPPILTHLLVTVHWQIICRDRNHRISPACACITEPARADSDRWGRPEPTITVVPQKPMPGTGSQADCGNEAKTTPPAAAAAAKRGREEWKVKIVDGVLRRIAAAQKQRSRVETKATKSNLSRGKVGSR